jgi:P27 family predicted phage terminase small subunit
MGQRGPAKEPLALKIAKATDRAEDRRSVAASMPSAAPVKPAWLEHIGDIASEVWDEAVADLDKTPGLLCRADGPALSAYCVAWQRFHDAQEQIARDGITCFGEKGGQYQHPAVGIQHKAIEIIGRIGAKFGMTPSDRSGLRLTKSESTGVRRRQA